MFCSDKKICVEPCCETYFSIVYLKLCNIAAFTDPQKFTGIEITSEKVELCTWIWSIKTGVNKTSPHCSNKKNFTVKT